VSGVQDKVGVFHPGTQHSWQTARALHEIGRLRWYATSIFYQPSRWPYRVTNYLPNSLRNKAIAEFKRFYHPMLPPGLVYTAGIHEWIERGLSRLGFNRAAGRMNFWGNRAFSKSICKLMKTKPVRAVWGYDTSSADAFGQAKQLGMLTILDRTIGDPRVYNSIMQEVYEQYPEFFRNRDFRISQKSIDVQDMEYSLADRILVGSRFCGETISSPLARPDVAQKIEIVPYCYDDVFFKPVVSPPHPANKPVRFLFLGQAAPRKGIHLLLKAFARIPSSAATLTIVGPLHIPADVFARFAERVTLYPQVARSDVAPFIRDCDCLVFPSYFEGSGIIVYEALACGRGVIQSTNATLDAIPSAGLALHRLDEQTLYEALMHVIDHPDILSQWQANAPKVAEQFTFTRYCEAVSRALSRIM
jgi:glycosyltransferase involved in cell wall biosynthesis